MKHCMLIGDSIRIGYRETVRKELEGSVEILSPEGNCRDTVTVLTHLHSWVLRQPPELVHINCGLHDLKTIIYGGRENLVPVEPYRRNVFEILKTIREKTPAKVIWATTTPINEQKAHAAHAEVADFDRFEADVAAYNQAAQEVCRKLGVPVNDLYSLVMEAGRDRLLLDDGVHFTPKGYELLGKAVAKAIRTQLQLL
jgi:lysophospholipase L1-like esterase